MKIKELASFLESVAPLNLQESYDNCGLIVGDPELSISGVMCSLDCPIEVLKEAKEKSCNVVVSHHPIIFSGLKKINSTNYVDKAVVYAIKNDIAIYAIHTNLDNTFQNGVNERIAQSLELKHLQLLLPKAGSINTGSGVMGELETAMETTAFLNYVKVCMKTKLLRHTRLVEPTVVKIAVAGGAGSFLIKEAIRAGAHVFISADLKYHEFFEANDQILLIDVGHFESEQFTIDLLFRLISEKFPNFASHCTKISTNPVQYF